MLGEKIGEISGRITAQRVLPFRALDVLEDLPQGGLANVQVGPPFEMVKLDGEGFFHGRSPSWFA